MKLRCPICLHQPDNKSENGIYYCSCGYSGKQTDYYAEDIDKRSKK